MIDENKTCQLNFLKCFLVSLFFTNTTLAKDTYSPYVDQNYPANIYWGDTHLHTNLSIDANIYGNKALGQEEAYRFARGEVVTANNGMNVRLQRPLDFLVVADHAVNLGVVASLQTADPLLLNTDIGKELYAKFLEFNTITKESERISTSGEFFSGKKLIDDKEGYFKSIWQGVTATADKYNNPGKFTTLIGYEWTSRGISPGGNLHRVVIFKDNADKVNQILPFSFLDSKDPEDLWDFLDNYQQKTGGDALAIPHNGNLSDGEMFSSMSFKGQPLSQDYAKTRSRWEPIYEVTQIKGDSETHPVLSPTDKFADYETWNSWAGRVSKEGARQNKIYEYARSGLKLGLKLQDKLGVNPFKIGLIGSTDSHTSLSTADEDNFFGKFTDSEPRSGRMMEQGWLAGLRYWQSSAAGYAAVWAKENTREALFAAMKRKEVYATTGPRITVRFFGGWDYVTDHALRPDLAKIGYSRGVPMGGDLTNAPKNTAPSFLIRAVKDPEGANLDRVQVIKGWRDKRGELHEKIYNVALSDDRKEDKNGKALSVGNTVDVKNASYTNSIGDPELAVVWQDPDFDKDEIAFYYLRVLEIPTPRWTAYDARFFGLTNIPEEVPMISQERAYSSPIWYTPKHK